MNPEVIFACIAVIAVGIAIIMYTLLRTPKTPAGMGDRPSIDLGDMPESDEGATEEEPEVTEEEPEVTEEEEKKSE